MYGYSSKHALHLPCGKPRHSESELLEEEVDGWLLLVILIRVVEPLLEDVLDLLSQLLSSLWVLHLVLSYHRLKFLAGLGELTSHLESGGEDVVVVHDLGEWLDLGSSRDSALRHSLADSEWGSFDTSDEGMGEGLSLLSVVELLDNDGLFTCSSSSEQDNDSTRFHATEVLIARLRVTYIFFMVLVL